MENAQSWCDDNAGMQKVIFVLSYGANKSSLNKAILRGRQPKGIFEGQLERNPLIGTAKQIE